MVKAAISLILITQGFLLFSVSVGSTNGIDSCAQNPSVCSLEQLCKRGISGNIYDMNFFRQKYALEAKQRFLTPAWCKQQRPKAVCIVRKMAACSNSEICNKANYIDEGKVYWWSSVNLRLPWTNEAKGRGLTCSAY